MPFVMLKQGWPGQFRRTINLGTKERPRLKKLEFMPGEPVEIMPHEVDLLRSDIGIALLPVEFDKKGRTRIITDDVFAEDDTEEQLQSDPHKVPPKEEPEAITVDPAPEVKVDPPKEAPVETVIESKPVSEPPKEEPKETPVVPAPEVKVEAPKESPVEAPKKNEGKPNAKKSS